LNPRKEEHHSYVENLFEKGMKKGEKAVFTVEK